MPKRVLLIGVLACVSTSVWGATAWRVTPALELAETYSDNVELTPSGDERFRDESPRFVARGQ